MLVVVVAVIFIRWLIRPVSRSAGLVFTVDPGMSAAQYRTTFTYNPAGQQLTETSPLGHVTTNTYDDAGRVAWEIHGNPGYVYRATRIASLYRPGHGTPR